MQASFFSSHSRLDRYEVTFELWDKVLQWGTRNGYLFSGIGEGAGAKHPVVTVSWFDVVKWLNARSEMEGRNPVYFTTAAKTTVYKTGEISLTTGMVKWEANGPHLRIPEDAREPLNFILTPPPGAPPLINSTSQPDGTLFANWDLSYATELKTWKDGSFQSLQRLDPEKMTIVLTHGCASGPNEWPKVMAETLVQRDPKITERANIVAWDWRDAAFSESTFIGGCAGCDVLWSGICSRPRQNTPEQGRLLGGALRKALGADYQRPVHFMGHSLGTLVNAVAADFVQGEHPKSELPGWPSARTHVTLFDHAGSLPEFRVSPSPLGWALPLPKRSGYVDNYITLVGILLNEPGQNIVNVFLQRSANSSAAEFHGYPYAWYMESVKNPGGTGLGFRHAVAYTESLWQSAGFPVPGRYPRGAIFAQDESSASSLDLVKLEIPEGLLGGAAFELVSETPLLGVDKLYALRAATAGVNGAVTIVGGLKKTARKIGDVTISIKESILDRFGESFNLFNDSPWVVYGSGQTTPAIIGIPGLKEELSPVTSWGLQLDLRTQPFLSLPRPQGGKLLAAAGQGETNSPAYAWLPLRVPDDAIALIFDFTISGEAARDRIVTGVNSSNIFNLAAADLASDAPMNTGPLPISGWAGEEIELFIGLAGGTSTNAHLRVSSIRFLSLPTASLVAENSGGKLVLSRVEASPNLALERTASLAPAQWQAVENVGGYPGQRRYTNNFEIGSSFFRLRQAIP